MIMKKITLKNLAKSKAVWWCVLVVAGVGISALLGSVCLDAANTAWRVSEALQAWQNMGLRGTAVWRVQEFLAQLSWLGPLRPNPPQDPLRTCGVQAEVSWWSLLVGARQTTRLLHCLEEQVKEAVEDHAAFQTKVVYTLTCVLAAISVQVLVFWKAKQDTCADSGSETDAKKMVTGPSEAEIDVPAGGSCDDVSSDEYEECQEDTRSLSPENSKECTEEALSELHQLSAAKTQCTTNEVKVPPSQTQEGVTKKKRRRRKKTVKADLTDDGGEWQTVNGKKKRPKQSPQKEQEEEKTNKCPGDASRTKERPQPRKRPRKKKPAKARRKAAPREDSRERLRQQWREDTMEVMVPVPPKRRQHVIGPRGDTIRQLRQDYPAVRVSVPLPQDLTSQHVTLEGPKSQVAAAAQDITGRLEAIDALIREAAKRREGDNVTVLLEVEPNMRRRVVGPGGEKLVRLAQEHPGVVVRVPPATDTHTRTVALRGPPGEVAAVEACLKATLQAAQRQREFQKARKRRLRKQTTNK